MAEQRPEITNPTDLLRHVAHQVDCESLPQTAEDTGDFCDGARWATAEVRRVAEEMASLPDDPGWWPDWLVDLARKHSEATGPERHPELAAADAQERERRLARDLIGYVEQRLDTGATLLQWRIAQTLRYLDQVQTPNTHTLNHVRRYLTGGRDNER